MNKDDLKKFVEENPRLVSLKPAGDGLFILKYKKCVFFDDLWNDYLEECRGTIVDDDFNIVQYPFRKIYNYGIESKAPVIPADTPVTAYRKVNGFMVAVTWHNNDLLISTTGTTDSEFVGYAREMIGDDVDYYRQVMEANPEYTYLFECCHPSDPHIVPEDKGMYLLGVRRKAWGSPVEVGPWMEGAAFIMRCRVPEVARVTMEVLQDLASRVHHEGFVFYTDDGVSAKIKSPHYLVSKFVARCGRLDRLTGQAARARVDEEFYPLLEAIEADIDQFSSLDEQSRLSWVRGYYGIEK